VLIVDDLLKEETIGGMAGEIIILIYLTIIIIFKLFYIRCKV
jgi:hypothetical protein